jgi:integrase
VAGRRGAAGQLGRRCWRWRRHHTTTTAATRSTPTPDLLDSGGICDAYTGGQGKSSYAWQLREALWLTGIVRSLPGFEEAREAWQLAQADVESAVSKNADRATLDALVAAAAAAEAQARKLCLIQAGSEDFKPLDFHSFRRAFATGLASSGMNVQQAMALAGHRNASTHMLYVRITEVLDIPEAALPKLTGAATVPFALLAASQTSVFSGAPGMIRTCDPRIRSPMLYPAELRVRKGRG